MSADKEHLYRDEFLHEQFEHWISAHQRDSADSFGKLLFEQVIMETCELLSESPKDNELLAELLPQVRQNLSEFYAQLLKDGVTDPDKNRQNLGNFKQDMHMTCQKMFETHTIIMGDEHEFAIDEIQKLARAQDPSVYDRIGDSDFNFYSEQEQESFESIIARSEALESNYTASRIFNRMNCFYLDGHNLSELEAQLFTANPDRLAALPNKVNFCQCEFVSKNVITITNEGDLNFSDYKKLFKKHDVINYKNAAGHECYSIFDPKIIRLHERERA